VERERKGEEARVKREREEGEKEREEFFDFFLFPSSLLSLEYNSCSNRLMTNL
jgi:hypothetical protein